MRSRGCIAALLSASPALAQQAGTSGRLAEAEKLLTSGDVKGAISSLDRFVRASPRSYEGRLALGRALDLDGRHADARRHLEEALKLAPDETSGRTALTALGVSYAFEAKADEAARYYQRAFDADIQTERSRGSGGPGECARADLSGVGQPPESGAVVHHRLRDVAPDSRAAGLAGGALGDAPAQRARPHRGAPRQPRRGERTCRGRQGVCSTLPAWRISVSSFRISSATSPFSPSSISRRPTSCCAGISPILSCSV